MTMTVQKRIASALAAAMLIIAAVLLLVPSALAEETPYIRDHYGLFSSSEVSSLESQAERVSDELGIATYFVVVDDVGSYSARDYAISYFKQFDLGRGSNSDAIMFLVAVDSRDYVTITQGKGIEVYTDYRLYQMEDEIVPYLSDGDWEEAAETYLNCCAETEEFYEENDSTPLDSDNDPDEAFMRLITRFGIVVVGSLVIALIVIAGMRSGMKTARDAVHASVYQRDDTFEVTDSHDTLVNVAVSKTPRAQSSSGGGGSRGSTISGGFGGTRGGKF